jgi:hypothetical protein
MNKRMEKRAYNSVRFSHPAESIGGLPLWARQVRREKVLLGMSSPCSYRGSTCENGPRLALADFGPTGTGPSGFLCYRFRNVIAVSHLMRMASYPAHGPALPT